MAVTRFDAFHPRASVLSCTIACSGKKSGLAIEHFADRAPCPQSVTSSQARASWMCGSTELRYARFHQHRISFDDFIRGLNTLRNSVSLEEIRSVCSFHKSALTRHGMVDKQKVSCTEQRYVSSKQRVKIETTCTRSPPICNGLPPHHL